MACNCNQTTNYNLCNPAPCQEPQDCSCPTILKSDCVTYSGNDLECSGIVTGQTLTETIEQLDTFICEKVDDITNALTLKNIGTGAKVYKGDDLLGRKELRTVTKTGNLVTVTENTNDIAVSIDESALNTFIEANQKTYSVANVGTGVEVYKDSTVVGDNVQFNFRTLTSEGNSVTITQGINTINLEVDIEPAIICLTSTDKTVTVTEVEGCFDLSVNLPTSVNVGTGEDVYKTFNLFTNQNEFKTLKSNNSTISLSPSIDELSLDVNNLQKTINTFPYTLTNSDDKYTIFINNESNNVTINIPDGLNPNFCVSFIQEGNGEVAFLITGTGTLSTAIGNKIKGQYYWALLEKKINTSEFYLIGSLKV